MDIPFVQVDAFTREPFRGNSAAIMFLDRTAPVTDAWMQAVAAEMNLAETAYLFADDGGAWSLRWFTPTVEVELCGHATLAAAFALWSEGRAPRAERLEFNTLSGRLTAAPVADDRIELDFPARISTPQPAPADVLDALGITTVEHSAIHQSGYFLFALRDEAAVRGLAPDFGRLRNRPESYIVTAPTSDTRYDFVSRYFAPAHGIDEDPVTGSAHCLLGPYWSERLGQPVVTGHQVSARSGVVECEPRADRVLLRGHAVLIARGTLCV